MRMSSFAIAFVLVSITGVAGAATCPEPGAIKQSLPVVKAGESPEPGVVYSVDQTQWKGENPMGDLSDDLKSYKFDSAKVSDKSVVCRYIGGDSGFVSISLQGAKAPDGSGWKDSTCSGTNVSSCAFK